jgi:serine/threonine-protein kinase
LQWNNELAAKALKPLAPPEKVIEAAQSELQKLLLLRHPYVTYVFDAFEYENTVYLITERCYGPLSEPS